MDTFPREASKTTTLFLPIKQRIEQCSPVKIKAGLKKAFDLIYTPYEPDFLKSVLDTICSKLSADNFRTRCESFRYPHYLVAEDPKRVDPE